MEIKDRPKITIPQTLLEKILDITTIILFIIGMIYCLQQWMTLPDQIPIHFNMKGEPDGWGGKWGVWLPLVIGLILWIGLSQLEKYPHTYNYLNLNMENAERQYKNARLMINLMKTEISIFFIYISWMIIEFSSADKATHHHWLPIVIFIIVLFSSIGFFIYRSFKLK